MELHSDKELGESSIRNVEHISKEVWYGIRGLIQRYIVNNGLAKDFPLICPDGTYTYGCDENWLNAAIRSVIPRIEGIDTYEQQKAEDFWSHIQNEEEQAAISDEERTYDVLDLTEFIYSYLHDCRNSDYHGFWRHYHIEFVEGNSMKESFCENINDIFRRNKIAYELSNEGKIKRTIPVSHIELFKVKHNTKDEELNNMLNLAVDKFLSPKIEDRRIGLEKLWDAFERLKSIEYTPEDQDKRASAEAVLFNTGNDNNDFIECVLRPEMQGSLTNIGNKFFIRHSEVDQTRIEDPAHIDYLFYRMMALVNLFLAKYNQ